MSNRLSGKKVAMLVTNGFERAELVEPRDALLAEGAKVDIVSLKKERVKAWNHKEWGEDFDVDAQIDEASNHGYDALVLPGGVMNPDYLRMDERAVRFVRSFAESGKLVAAICHAPWVLIEARVVRGRRVTSYPSLKMDLQNAGATWVDEVVVKDGNFLTSRRPTDLPEFCSALVEALATGSQPLPREA